MGAQILGIKSKETDNDALETLVDFLGDRVSFDAIFTLALSLHREYEIMIAVDLEDGNKAGAEKVIFYFNTQEEENSCFELQSAKTKKKYRLNFEGIDRQRYGAREYYNIMSVISNLLEQLY